jgi:hypothetical protein
MCVRVCLFIAIVDFRGGEKGKVWGEGDWTKIDIHAAGSQENPEFWECMNESNKNEKVGLNLPPWLLHVCIRSIPIQAQESACG